MARGVVRFAPRIGTQLARPHSVVALWSSGGAYPLCAALWCAAPWCAARWCAARW